MARCPEAAWWGMGLGRGPAGRLARLGRWVECGEGNKAALAWGPGCVGGVGWGGGQGWGRWGAGRTFGAEWSYVGWAWGHDERLGWWRGGWERWVDGLAGSGRVEGIGAGLEQVTL